MTPDLSYNTALGGREKCEHRNEWDGKTKRSEVYYCCCNNTIPKPVAPIDSIWTDCCCVMQKGPCSTSLITRSGHGQSPYWARMLDRVKLS